MLAFKRLLNYFCLVLSINAIFITNVLQFNELWTGILLGLLILFFIKFNLVPIRYKNVKNKLLIMINGCELLFDACLLFAIQSIVLIYRFFGTHILSPIEYATTIIISMVVVIVMIWNGMLRLIFTSSQLTIVAKVLLFMWWWVPILNLVLFVRSCGVARREYFFELSKIELNQLRAENEICKTKYPILMVHGIFWRDWQFFNYWGRIPKELIRNGATIYYGHQHSSSTMDICATELKEQILEIVDKEKCDKVHIIGHSKGGLDARYTVSCMGIEEHIASVTTIGTPHKGSKLIDYVFDKCPDKLIKAVAKRYDAAYRRLGDVSPDFYNGILDLTSNRIKVINEKAVNMDGVLYQSVASKMNNFFSASFPLNLGYLLLSKEGINDGFVTMESSKHGNFLGCLETDRTRGISHGDMIDLMRENIHGFDICEYYVEIVKGLKHKGL